MFDPRRLVMCIAFPLLLAVTLLLDPKPAHAQATCPNDLSQRDVGMILGAFGSKVLEQKILDGDTTAQCYLQLMLKFAGYPLTADGAVGPKTRDTLSRFATEKCGLPPRQDLSAETIACYRSLPQQAIAVQAARVGSMLGFFFNDREVKNFDDAKTSDLDTFAKSYNGLRQNGVYIAPSQFEALFLSAAHDAEHIEATIAAAEKVLDELRS